MSVGGAEVGEALFADPGGPGLREKLIKIEAKVGRSAKQVGRAIARHSINFIWNKRNS